MDTAIADDKITVGSTRNAVTDHYCTIDVPYGKMLVNAHDPLIESSLRDNVTEIEELKQFARGVALDIGANVGTHSIGFSKVADVVYAFEPQPRTYYNLCANLLLNLIFNVVPLNQAIGSYCGETRVASLDPTVSNTWMGVQVGNGDQPVSMLTIDALGISPIHFIKIDVEGHEMEVLKGAGKTLERENAIFYVEIHAKESIEPICAYMKSHGYLAKEHIIVCMPDRWLVSGYLFWKEGRIKWCQS